MQLSTIAFVMLTSISIAVAAPVPLEGHDEGLFKGINDAGNGARDTKKIDTAACSKRYVFFPRSHFFHHLLE